MSKIKITFAKKDYINFETIKNGLKKFETRAATPKHRSFEAGSIVVFECNGEQAEKRIKTATVFPSIEEMLEVLELKEVMPYVDTIEEVRAAYYSYPNYEEKIKEFGLIAFELE